MKICGLNKTTLLDYPGRIACTIFLGGCNFRCPFCHNSSLILSPESQPSFTEEEVLAFLKKRKGILEGVCITGGEPTIYKELPDFLHNIKMLGYPIKLDTNGSHPDTIKFLVKKQLIDCIAMDIKSSPQNYSLLCGVAPFDISVIKESVDFIMHGFVDYEFRTTVVKELHSFSDFQEIGEWIFGANAYYLQAFKDSGDILKPGFHSFSLEELKEIQRLLWRYIPLVKIRGLD